MKPVKRIFCLSLVVLIAGITILNSAKTDIIIRKEPERKVIGYKVINGDSVEVIQEITKTIHYRKIKR